MAAQRLTVVIPREGLLALSAVLGFDIEKAKDVQIAGTKEPDGTMKVEVIYAQRTTQ